MLLGIAAVGAEGFKARHSVRTFVRASRDGMRRYRTRAHERIPLHNVITVDSIAAPLRYANCRTRARPRCRSRIKIPRDDTIRDSFGLGRTHLVARMLLSLRVDQHSRTGNKSWAALRARGTKQYGYLRQADVSLGTQQLLSKFGISERVQRQCS